MTPSTLFARMLRLYLIDQAEPDGTLVRSTAAPGADLARLLGANGVERRQLVEAVDQMLLTGVLVWGADRRLWIERRSRGAERQARWRERRRLESVTRDVTGDVTRDAHETSRETQRETFGSPPLPLSSPSPSGSGSDSGNPDPLFASGSDDLKGSPRVPAKRKPNAVPVPEPFPVDAVLVYGRSKGLTEAETRSQCEALVLWAKGKAERKVDWVAAAQGWIRRYVEERGGRNGWNKPPGLLDHEQRRGQLDPAQRLRLAESFRSMARDPELTEQQRADVKRKLAELEAKA